MWFLVTIYRWPFKFNSYRYFSDNALEFVEWKYPHLTSFLISLEVVFGYTNSSVAFQFIFDRLLQFSTGDIHCGFSNVSHIITFPWMIKKMDFWGLVTIITFNLKWSPIHPCGINDDDEHNASIGTCCMIHDKYMHYQNQLKIHDVIFGKAINKHWGSTVVYIVHNVGYCSDLWRAAEILCLIT